MRRTIPITFLAILGCAEETGVAPPPAVPPGPPPATAEAPGPAAPPIHPCALAKRALATAPDFLGMRVPGTDPRQDGLWTIWPAAATFEPSRRTGNPAPDYPCEVRRLMGQAFLTCTISTAWGAPRLNGLCERDIPPLVFTERHVAECLPSNATPSRPATAADGTRGFTRIVIPWKGRKLIQETRTDVAEGLGCLDQMVWHVE